MNAFAKFIEDLRGRYDHIIIDTPPVLVVPDARVIGKLCDAMVYVVQWDKTSHAQVQAGIEELRNVRAPLVGVTLSRVDGKAMRRYGYGGRYGAYSAYGRKYYGT